MFTSPICILTALCTMRSITLSACAPPPILPCHSSTGYCEQKMVELLS